jgi:hypothetical protein
MKYLRALLHDQPLPDAPERCEHTGGELTKLPKPNGIVPQCSPNQLPKPPKPNLKAKII